MRMLEEAKFLKALNYEVEVWTPKFAGADKMANMLDEFGVPYRSVFTHKVFTSWRWRHFYLLTGLAHAKLTRRMHAFDLVHVFFSWVDQGLDQLWFSSLSRVPSIASAHNAFPSKVSNGFYNKRLKEAFGLFIGGYGVSDAAREGFLASYEQWFPHSCDFYTQYNSIDVERFSPREAVRAETRKRLGLSVDDFVIGSVGRFEEQKQPVSVVETFSQVADRIPNAQLLMVGDGRDKSRVLARIRDLNLEARVKVLPFEDNVENIFAALDAHILLSKREGFGLVTAEAMACGVPVVGTRVTGTEEVIEGSGGGFLVPYGDLDAAAGSLVMLAEMNSEDLKRTGERARESIVRRFSTDVCEAQAAERYNQFLTRTA